MSGLFSEEILHCVQDDTSESRLAFTFVILSEAKNLRFFSYQPSHRHFNRNSGSPIISGMNHTHSTTVVSSRIEPTISAA